MYIEVRVQCVCMYFSEGEGWDFTKQLGNVIIIMLGLVGLFN